MIAWHYTTADRWADILADGEVRPATGGLEMGDPDEEMIATLERIVATGHAEEVAIPFTEEPAVWFSVRRTWEPTASKGIIDRRTGERRNATIEEMIKLAGGLVRVGVSTTLVPATWHHHVRTSGIRPKMAKSLAKAARQVGSDPNDWRVCYGAVPRSLWGAVQRWNGATWIDDESFDGVAPIELARAVGGRR